MGIYSKVRDVVDGKQALGKTFWFWWALPLVAIGFLRWGVVSHSLWFFAQDPSGTAYYIAFYSAGIIAFAQLATFAAATWRSAGNAKSKGWGIAAKVVVGIVIFETTLRLFQASVSPTHETSVVNQFKSKLAMLQAQLPVRYDSFTTLTGLTYKNSQLAFHYVISPDATIDEANRPVIVQWVCKEFKTALGTPDLGSIRITYTYGTNGQSTSMIDVQKSDCT
jgi:hypothetical protein